MKTEMNLLTEKINLAAGRELPELVLKNATIVNVFSHELLEADVAISDGIIIGVGEYRGHQEIDMSGKYLAPGLIDSHMHLESSMVSPMEYSQAVIPSGTTTIIADPHEIANVMGDKGIEYLMGETDELPLDAYFMLPSCVPSTEFETAGAELTARDLKTKINHPRVLGLGELMDFPSVIGGEEEIISKINLAQDKIIDGHAPGITGRDLNAYVLSGVKTEHECSSTKEMLDRLRLGMYIAIRQGTAAKNLGELINGISPENARRCTFCSDDKHPEDILNEGHIDQNLRLAVKGGISPVTAVQMATLNAAECYGLTDKGAVAPGYQADLVVFDDLTTFNVSTVLKDGQVVYQEEGEESSVQNIINHKETAASTSTSSSLSDEVLDTINLSGFDAKKLQMNLSPDNQVNVIELVPENIITRKQVRALSVTQGGEPDLLSENLNKIAVVERHKGSGNVGLGLVAGFDLRGGAIASTVAHDSHNLICVGDNNSDMEVAIHNLASVGGGLTIVKQGQVLETLPLPIAGLMSKESIREVSHKSEQLLELAVSELSVDSRFNPFMTMSFLALPVLPELKVTDKGLFDGVNFQFLELDASK